MSLREIASNLSLSVTTVSRALGGHSDVSEATRVRIMREASRLGYVPNEMARRLQKGRADAIGFVIPGGPDAFEDAFFLKIIQGAWSRLADEDMDLLVMSAPSGPQEMKLYHRLVDGRRVDGLILTRVTENDPRVKYLLDADFPFVTISAGKCADSRVVSVDLDNLTAMRLALQRLKDLGHQVIACCGPRNMQHSSRRLDIFARLCDEMGLIGVEMDVEHTTEAGEAVIGEILDHQPDVTAIVCNTDRIGFGAVQGLSNRGLRAGRDLSIIAFGDNQLTRISSPQLSVLRLPTEDMAVRAVDLLLKLRSGIRFHSVPDMQAELILRETDGSPLHRVLAPAKMRAR